MRFRLNRLLIGRLAIAFCLLGLPVLNGTAQGDAGRWLRVFTEEDSIIEVDRSSLVLEQDRVIRAEFRTTFVNPVPLTGLVQGRYHSRLDSIQFRLDDKRFRVRESRFLDPSGRVLSASSTVADNAWKSVWGRTGTGLFSAATQLYPFGVWKVVSYRYASGERASGNEPSDLKALMASDMSLAWNQVRVANLTCPSPILEPTVMTGEEFSRRVGSSLESLGMTDKVDAIYLRCPTKSKTTSTVSDAAPVLLRGGIVIVAPSKEPLVNNSLSTKFPPTTLILRRPDNRVLMLWEGVFLELERTKNLFRPESF
jgi:hypothetical protein